MNVELIRISFHDCEHALGREPPRREVPVARDTSENSSLRDASRIFPAGDGGVRPQRNRHTPNPAHFASQVDDDPAAISLLKVLAVQARQLRPTQARAEENGKHGDVAVSLERLQIRKCQELFCLFYRKPMAQAHSAPFCAFGSSDARRKFRSHHTVVGGFKSQAADGRQADVNAGGRQAFDLQLRTVLLNGGFIELAFRVVAEPDQELVESLRVRTPRVTGGDAIQYKRCDDSPSIIALSPSRFANDDCRRAHSPTLRRCLLEGKRLTVRQVSN